MSPSEGKKDIDPPTMSADTPDERTRPTTTTASTFVNLPVEIKSHIASFLEISDAKALVQTCKSWQEPTELYLWREITLDPLKLLFQANRERFPHGLSSFLWYEHYPNLPQEIIVEGKALWDNFYRTITQKPVRLAYLKKFNFIAAVAFWPEMSRVMPIIAPHVEELCPWSSLTYSDHLPDCVLGSVDVARSLPRLKALDLVLTGSSRYVKLASALRSTPNLEELTFKPGDYYDGYGEGPQVEVFPEFPKLSRLNLAHDDDLNCMIRVFGIKAGSLRCLHLYDIEALDLPPVVSDDLSGYSNLETLAITSPAVLEWVLPLLSLSGPLPKLQRLIASITWGPQMIPGHPNLRQLDVHGEGATAIGTYGRPQETGRLGQAMATSLLSAPNLSVIGHFHPPWKNFDLLDRIPDDSYFIRTFTAPGTEFVLYHVRVHLHVGRIGSRSLASARHVYDLDHNLDRMENRHDLEVMKTADRWTDITNYRGWPLPLCLLNYIYEVVGEDRAGTAGKRGMQLPGEIWELLEQWRTEVENQVWDDEWNSFDGMNWEGTSW